MGKAFKLPADAIQPLVHDAGACYATDMITVDGLPVRWMYREKPDNPWDSGWRFMSGLESDEYMDQPSNFEIYDVNTIANYDPSIIPFLDADVGSAFEKPGDHNTFLKANDWEPPNDE
jgi:hypothetical protein